MSAGRGMLVDRQRAERGLAGPGAVRNGRGDAAAPLGVGLLLAVLASLASLLAGCDEPERQVVLYYSADEYVARPVIEAFEAETGIEVLAVGDTEALKTTGLVQRLRSEAERPRADVFWSSEIFLTLQLAEEGILEPWREPAEGAPERPRDPEDRWHGFAARARVIAYDTRTLDATTAPQTLHDLVDPAYRDRIVLADPRFGTTRGHLGALLLLWGEDELREWLATLDDLGVRLVDGNSAVVRAIAQGEALVGLTDTDDVWSAQRNDWPVDLTYARHDLPGGPAIGPMVIPNTVARVAGGPNPAEADALMRFLLGARVERMLAESDSHNVPVRPALASEFPRYTVPDPATLDPAAVANAIERALQIASEELGP